MHQCRCPLRSENGSEPLELLSQAVVSPLPWLVLEKSVPDVSSARQMCAGDGPGSAGARGGEFT